MISTISEIRGDNINWNIVGARLREFRISKNLDLIAAAEQVGYNQNSLRHIENGQTRKCVNFIFRISQAWDLSLNWLLNGVGKFHDPDPSGLIPPTLIVYSGAGISRDESKKDGDEGQYSDEAMEFVIAIDKYKQINQVPFPSTTQIFDIVLALGYRKCVPSRIAPLGYFINQQKQSEQLKQISEPTPRTNLFAEYAEKEAAKDNEQSGEKMKVSNIEAAKFKKKFWESRREAKKANERTKIAEKKVEELRQQHKVENSKKKPRRLSNDAFKLIDPSGNSYITTDLIKFCAKHHLNAVKIYELAHNSDSQTHDGWVSEIIF